MSKKPKGTPMFITPTLEECEHAAMRIDLPPIEAKKFYHFYQSKGWRVGTTRMVSFNDALAGWKLRWMERTGGVQVGGGATGSGAMSPAMITLFSKEFDRVVDRMKAIRNSYGEMQIWTRRDSDEYTKLMHRKAELKKALGLTI